MYLSIIVIEWFKVLETHPDVLSQLWTTWRFDNCQMKSESQNKAHVEQQEWLRRAVIPTNDCRTLMSMDAFMIVIVMAKNWPEKILKGRERWDKGDK